MYRGDLMESASMLEKFKQENPRRRVIFLNCKNDKYFDEYVSFNLDILKSELSKTTLDISFSKDEIFIKGDNIFEALLFECGILCALSEGGAILRPYANACDIMSAICRIVENFGK